MRTTQLDMSGQTARRERAWDSCFNPDYSYVVGGNTRPNIRSRYRQWLTHKFGHWYAQFGRLGLRGLRALHHLVPCRHRPDRGNSLRSARRCKHDPQPSGQTSRHIYNLPHAALHGLKSPRSSMKPRCFHLLAASSWTRPAGGFRFKAGQFNMLLVPGLGEAAISISSDMEDHASHRPYHPHRRQCDHRHQPHERGRCRRGARTVW